MDNIKQFSVEKYSISKYKSDPRFLMLTMNVCCSNKLANDSIFLDESIENCKDTFINMPIVAKVKNTYNSSDFEGHEMNLKLDKDGNQYYEFIEKPIGIVPESSNIRIIQDELNSKQNWIVVDALIWVDRDKDAFNIIKKRKNIGISMEVKFDDYYIENGIEYVKKFTGNAITLLGSKIPPAFKTSMAKINEQFSTFKEAMCFALENEPPSKFTLPSSIKEIIQQQMDAIRNSPMNTTVQISTLLTAKDLLANDDISLEQGEIILQKIHEHESESEDLNKQVLAMLLGGDLMKEFVKSIGGQDKNFVSKDDYGTSDAIKISLTKASASNDSWGSIDKTKLKNDLLIASNYQSLVDKVYLVVDSEWEDAPSSSLHYPVCQIKNNTLIYNIHGVQSARLFLEKNKDAPYFNSANTKLNKIYKKLGLDYDKNHIKYNEKEVKRMINKFKELFAQENKYKFVGFNDKTVCVYSIEKSNFEVLPYSIGEEDHITMDTEKAKGASMSCKFADDEDGDVDFECKEMFETMSEVFADIAKLAEEKTTLMSEKEVAMAEKDAEVEKSKQLAEEKEEFAKEKDKAIEEKQMAETEKEKAMSEKAEFEVQFSALKTENEKIVAEVNGFKEQKFAEIIKYCTNKYKMSDEDIVTWTEKSKTFAQVEDFEKELVFTFHKASFKEDIHFKMGNLLNDKNKNAKGKSAIQRLKEKQ